LCLQYSAEFTIPLIYPSDIENFREESNYQGKPGNLTDNPAE